VGGGSSRKTGNAEADRFAQSAWRDLVLPALAASTGPESGAGLDDQLRGLLKVSDMDPKPALLYFHFPHEEKEKDKVSAEGRVSKKQCGNLVDDEVARWCSLFKCYEVDMAKSDRGAADRLGAGAGTSYAVIDGKLQVAAKSGPLANSRATVQFLRETLQASCPVYWDGLQKRVEEQKVVLEEARKLAARKDWGPALEKYDLIRLSDLRIGDFFDDAVSEAAKVEAKVQQQK
jgi:hypothetical protein